MTFYFGARLSSNYGGTVNASFQLIIHTIGSDYSEQMVRTGKVRTALEGCKIPLPKDGEVANSVTKEGTLPN
ncbi:hypothetical protein HOLleu_15771 [Holothuria leucospilota]|uniref:Uncharacterized protein n=1 Tax=Holothuria leucospilota TaxID=206669 RepID=A0A9Q1H9V9_HOLLE|nr:hypothetical protein HOLleu_15771 [Holothuria leucospilota]